MVNAYSGSSRRAFLTMCAGTAVLPAISLDAKQSQAPSWRTSFPALSQQVEGRPLAYLDSAATTLRPQAVIDALVNFYSTDNANPSPVHTLASRAANRLSAARATVAKFINAPNPNEVIFTRGTSEGMNLLASTVGATLLHAGDDIILTVAEHNSNLMPWTRAARQAGAHLRVVDVDDEGHLRLDQLKQLLSSRTKLVAFSHVSNVLGLINPAKEICAMARSAGARVVIDGAQSVPHTKVDVQDIGCDFYVFSGHKVLGPMATGVVWGRLALLDEMPPYHVGMQHGSRSRLRTLVLRARSPQVSGWHSRRRRSGWSGRRDRLPGRSGSRFDLASRPGTGAPWSQSLGSYQGTATARSTYGRPEGSRIHVRDQRPVADCRREGTQSSWRRDPGRRHGGVAPA